MALPIKPNNPEIPIPNNPFSAPLNPYLQGPYFPFVAGPGVDLSTPGIPTITNDVAAVLSAGSGISLSTVGGITTITATGGGGGSGTVTSITAGTGLTGGTITTSGTIALANTAVTPGTYNFATVTVDQQGRLTAASAGTTCSGTVTSIIAGTGLSGGTITTSGTVALANTAVTAGAYTYGSFTVDAQGRLTAASSGTAPVTNVTGTAPITSTGGATPAIGLADTVVTPGAYTYASLTVDAQGRLTAAGNGATPVIVNDFNAKGDLLVGTADNAFTALGVGADTSVLTADAACASGVKWAAGGGGGIPCSCITAKGDLITGTAASTPTTLTVGTDGQALLACSTATNGICWGSVSAAKACPGTLGTVYGYVGGNAKTDSSTGIGLCSMLSSTPTNTPTNSALGFATLCSMTSGGGNVAVGNSALRSMATGNGNTAVGYQAGQAAVGDNNVIVGGSSGSQVAGNQNAFFGVFSGCTQTSGDSNVSIGPNTALASTTGSCQLAIGFSATDYWLTGDSTKAIKPGAGIIDCAASTGTAGQVLMSNGTNAICWGTAGGGGGGTVTSITAGTGLTGGTITASGTIALDTACVIQPSAFLAKGDLLSASASATPLALTVGTNGQVLAANSACASGLEWVASGIPCSCITAKGALVTGTAADTLSTLPVGGDGCILVACSTASRGICWGNPACAMTNPSTRGIVVGCTTTNATALTALGAASIISNTTGKFLAAVGARALYCNTSGCNSSALGYEALHCNTTGCDNTAIGYSASYLSTTGGLNVSLGYCSGYNVTTGSQNVALGPNVQLAAAAGSCQLAIGFSSTENWLTGDSTKAIKPGAGIIDCANSCGNVGQYLWTTGTNRIIWSASSPSDTRDKEVIGPVPTALPIVQQIEPITYRWKERESDVAQEEVIYGFSAQQLQEVDSVLVDDSDPDHLRIHDRKIVPLLVNAIQELSAKVEALEAKLKANG